MTFKRHENDRERLKEVSRELTRTPLVADSRVPAGDANQLTNTDYMTLVNAPCRLCGDNTFNYLTRIDETKNFAAGNIISECGHCRRIRANSSLAQYKVRADQEV